MMEKIIKVTYKGPLPKVSKKNIGEFTKDKEVEVTLGKARLIHEAGLDFTYNPGLNLKATYEGSYPKIDCLGLGVFLKDKAESVTLEKAKKIYETKLKFSFNPDFTSEEKKKMTPRLAEKQPEEKKKIETKKVKK